MLSPTINLTQFMSAAEKEYDSAPWLSKFKPVIPYQAEVIDLIREEWDYSKGNPEILLSGSYGSAKSVLMAHLAITHCLKWKGARVCLCRKALPDLKKTILNEVLEHIDQDLKEGVDYNYNRSGSIIRFKNGSEIISISWADKKYKKGRSLKLSMLVFEELAENNEEDMEAFKTLKARLRRIPRVPENVLIAASNPDSPDHWVYNYFIEPNEGAKNHPTRFVFYSLTHQNPFLDPVYIEQLRQDLPPREADRYLRGMWIEIKQDRIYYEYDRENNYSDTEYTVDKNYPVYISWDFNIGEGKPLSLVLFQFIEDHMHIFDEIVIEGMRTLDSCEELADRGLLDYGTLYYVCGDATGKHKDTRNNLSDWEIIKKFFSNYKDLKWEFKVPTSNPKIRKRHNLVNAYCRNDLGKHRLTIYQKAFYADKGLRLTKLKKGAGIIEDDSKFEQHISTAIGYGLQAAKRIKDKRENRTIQL